MQAEHLVSPISGLEISCAQTVLRPLQETDIAELLALKQQGIVEPGTPNPFDFPWHKGPDQVCLKFWQEALSFGSREKWNLLFVVVHDGQIVGVQELRNGADVLHSHYLTSGSWLARKYQGQGIGTRMRQMLVGFGLEQLQVKEMRSKAFQENRASQKVSEKTGYRLEGTETVSNPDPSVPGEVTYLCYTVTKQTYIRPLEPITYQGVDAFKEFIGLS